jgi:hypothetical protein
MFEHAPRVRLKRRAYSVPRRMLQRSLGRVAAGSGTRARLARRFRGVVRTASAQDRVPDLVLQAYAEYEQETVDATS